MKTLKSSFLLCVFACLLCISGCENKKNSDIDVQIIEEQQKSVDPKYEDYWKDGEPIMVIDSILTTLQYSETNEMWYISQSYQGTIDSVDIYMIKEMQDNNFSYKNGQKVYVSGFCYAAPSDILLVPAGTTVYYIFITKITYEI